MDLKTKSYRIWTMYSVYTSFLMFLMIIFISHYMPMKLINYEFEYSFIIVWVFILFMAVLFWYKAINYIPTFRKDTKVYVSRFLFFQAKLIPSILLTIYAFSEVKFKWILVFMLLVTAFIIFQFIQYLEDKIVKKMIKN